MNTVDAKIAAALKQAGFPQPEPQPGQFWYNEIWQLHVMVRGTKNWRGESCMDAFIVGTDRERNCTKEILDSLYSFAPTLEDIAPLLPECIFETWDGNPSCKYTNEDQPIRTFGATFAEAAAKMRLILYT